MFKYLVEMDSDQLVCVLLSVLGEKIPVFYLGSKIFCSRTQSWAKLQESSVELKYIYK